MDINLTKKEGIKLKTAGKYCQEDINVKPVLQNKTINANGTYTADNNYAGLGTVTVSMSTATIKLQEKTAVPTTSAQTIQYDSGYTGLSKVTVSAIQTETKSITANGTYTPTDGKFFSSVSVNVPTGGETIPSYDGSIKVS